MKIKAILSTLILMVSLSSAKTIIIDADDTGWYHHRGYSPAVDSNVTGLSVTLGKVYYHASYFTFSIPRITDEIVDIRLCLELTYYNSPDDYEDILISGVSTSPSFLVQPHTNSDTGLAPSVYTDLTNGPEYATWRIEKDDMVYGQRPLLYCSFNETGRNHVLSASGKKFAIGLSLVDLMGEEKQYLGFNSGYGDPTVRTHQLHITTIPEPATMLLFASGILLIRKKKIHLR